MCWVLAGTVWMYDDDCCMLRSEFAAKYITLLLLCTGLSALDKAKEDRKILEWAGVGSNYSAAVREEPLEED